MNRPLTPIRRAQNPVMLPNGRIRPRAGIWRLPHPDANGVPGELVIHRPGGWRSAVALIRLLLALRP